MKKILISTSLVALIGVAVIGITTAFFNDTEASSGNIFVAGDLDLKVDHTIAYYNGLFCKENRLVEQCELGNLVKNGGFEWPKIQAGRNWDIFPNGTPGLDWQLKWRNDILPTWNGYTRPEPALKEYQAGAVIVAKEGTQIAELDTDWFGPTSNVNGEPGSVHIWQSIPTIPGYSYEVSFWYSRRPNVADNRFDASWNGGLLSSFNPVAGNTADWKQYTAIVTATAYSTILEFVDRGTADSMGVYLDDVSVVAKDCPTGNPLIGLVCAPTFEEKDLNGDKFFNFNDVKPGDWGRNVISVHNKGNKGWLCLNVANKVDDENIRINPEIDANDTSDVPGELSNYLTLFAWRDDNDNGVFEPSLETVIGTYTLKTLSNMPVYDSTTSTGPMNEDAINFIGLAWCAGQVLADLTSGAISCDGSTMLDDSQTDKFSADVTLYTEQWRNNLGFTCVAPPTPIAP